MFTHQVIIITGLNKCYDCIMFPPANVIIRDVIVKLPLGLKILRNQFHAPQAHVVVGGSGGIPP